MSTANINDRITAAIATAQATADASPTEIAGHSIPAAMPVVAMTGYYGRHDHKGRERTSVIHIALAGEHKPLCNAAMHADMAFHWCAQGVRLGYVECGNCLRSLPGAQTAMVAATASQVQRRTDALRLPTS